jgi:hypothetical protein
LTPKPASIDPLLGVLASRALSSPFSAAAAYGVLATGTSLLAAAFEGRLLGNTTVYWDARHFDVHPFLSNFSTLLDFAVLNPLVIFFLLRSRQIAVTEPLLAGAGTRADRMLRWFVSLACVVLTVVLMIAYSHSFLYGTFFDAVVTASEQGECFVTVTGWVVFFWTGLFTYLVLTGTINQVSYVVRICQLRMADVFYDPLHEDGAAGLRTLAKPAIEFTKASLSLLVIGVVFWVYDLIMMRATLTDRTASIGIFAAIVIPLFCIPIGRLHFLMCDLREGLLKSILGGEPREIRRAAVRHTRSRRGSRSITRLADEIEATEKLRATVMTFPTWPMSTGTLVTVGAYFASVVSPVLGKAVPLISSALGFSK